LEVDGYLYGDGSNLTGIATGNPAFTDITSGTNTSAAMVVGTGASLSFTGTGTITASELTCTGCVANTELANDSITFAGDSGSNASDLGTTLNIVGGGIATTSVSTNTLTVTATEADTLSSVTARGATTSDLVTLTGGLTAQGAVTGKALAIFDETGDQDIFTASNSGTTRMRIASNGDLYVGTGTFDNASASEDLYVTGNLEVDGYLYGDGSNLTGIATGNPAFTDITSGTNTSAAMVVGTGASLSFTGTGTITASELTCTGCVANSELANDSITLLETLVVMLQI